MRKSRAKPERAINADGNRRAKWGDEKAEAYLVRHYGKTRTQKQIAAHLKIGTVQVRRWAHFLGLQSPRASKPLPPGLLESIMVDWNDMSLAELSTKYGVPANTIWARIRMVKRRNAKETAARVTAVFSTIAALCGHGEIKWLELKRGGSLSQRTKKTTTANASAAKKTPFISASTTSMTPTPFTSGR